MAAFLNPIDICNRALQHCGVPRIDPVYGFTEVSTRAAACAFVYDKLRRYELRRNPWRFSIKMVPLRPLADTSRMMAPTLWQSTRTYFYGSLATDIQGNIWISMAHTNLGNAPGGSVQWELYFGPLAVPPWVDDTSYLVGDVVYKTPGDGTAKVYLSLEAANEDDPATVTAWSATAQYRREAIVTHSAVRYMSLIDFNLNQTPSASPLAWSSATTYAIGNQVRASNGYIYTSLQNANTNHTPTDYSSAWWTDTEVLCPWTRTGIRGSGSTKWLELEVALLDMPFLYPIGAGPFTNTSARRAYRLPANYLMWAPQSPKAGSASVLGGPSGLTYRDWDYQGDFLVTGDTGVIPFRFRGDIVSVASMDDMFCEGLAAHIGYEICPEVTQSLDKRKDIAAAYQKFMGEARIVNGIETGPTESPEDDFVTCRG